MITKTVETQNKIGKVNIKTSKNVKTRRRESQQEISLKEYVKSGKIDNSDNISQSFNNVDSLIKSMN